MRARGPALRWLFQRCNPMLNVPHSLRPTPPHQVVPVARWVKGLVSVAAVLLVASSISLSGPASTASAAGTASISGVVTSAGTPTLPVSNGTVSAFLADGSPAGSTLTGFTGNYSITGLSAGSYTLQFSGSFNSGLVSQWWKQKADQSTADYFAIGDGEAASGLDAQLQSGAVVSGRVLSGTTPTAGVVGSNVLIMDINGSIEGSTVSASDGGFSVGGLAPGLVTIDARAPSNSNYLEQWWSGKPSFATADFFSVSAGENIVDRNITLPTGATISGSVVTRAVLPVPLVSATVSAFRPDGTSQNQGTTDQYGNYTIAGLTPGPYRILFQSAEADNFGTAWWHNATSSSTATVVELGTGQAIVGIDAALEVGATISGTVSRADGGAPPDYFIEPIDVAGMSVPAVTGVVNGVYTISHLAPGSYTLHTVAFSGDLAEQWWDDSLSLASATYFSVPTGATLTGFDITLSLTGIVGGTPTISGAATVGQTLIAAAGAWTPASVGITYQWLRNGVAIGGATASTLTLTSADLGAVMTVAVTGSATGYAPISITSDPTAAVGSPAVSSTIPTATGTTLVGRTLTAQAGTWGPTPVSVSYRWSRDGTRIHGANRSQYELTDHDAGHTLTVTVTGSKRGFASSSVTSAPTALVTGGHLRTSLPQISGAARPGETLTVRVGSWGPGQVTLEYSWNRNGHPISGATSSTYALTGADVGAAITVTVRGSELGFTSSSRTSRSSSRIR